MHFIKAYNKMDQKHYKAIKFSFAGCLCLRVLYIYNLHEKWNTSI